MSCRGSGGHLFVCTAFHKHCAVNHLRWRVSASQRRVQPALNTEDRRASILLWLFSLIAAHPPRWDAAAADVRSYCAAPAVPVQRLLSNHLGRVSQNGGRMGGGQNFSLWQQSGKLKRGLLWFMHLHQYMDRLDKKKRLVSVLLLMKWDIFTTTDVSTYPNLYFRVTLEEEKSNKERFSL